MSLSSQPVKPPSMRKASVVRTQVSPSSSSNASVMPNSTSTSNVTNSMPSTFEFTKRKRWADLLIHELSEAIIFVLSNECKVLFCSRAVLELLGWRDAELIDKDLVDLVNGVYTLLCVLVVLSSCTHLSHLSLLHSSGEDQHAFRGSFDQSLHSRAEMLSYVRFRCQPEYATPAKEVLFEVKGYPHYIDDEPYARCFFAVAKPYPSRNTAM